MCGFQFLSRNHVIVTQLATHRFGLQVKKCSRNAQEKDSGIQGNILVMLQGDCSEFVSSMEF